MLHLGSIRAEHPGFGGLLADAVTRFVYDTVTCSSTFLDHMSQRVCACSAADVPICFQLGFVRGTLTYAVRPGLLTAEGVNVLTFAPLSAMLRWSESQLEKQGLPTGVTSRSWTQLPCSAEQFPGALVQWNRFECQFNPCPISNSYLLCVERNVFQWRLLDSISNRY